MTHLQGSRFLGARAKLEKQKYGSFQVAKRINNNAYVLDNWNISHTFNVVDLLKYLPDD